MTGCLADVAAALVDGELDHAAREKAQRHLLHCDACRAEVDLQRRLKTRLRDVGEPAPSDALTARLLGLAATAPLPAPFDPPEPAAGRAPAATGQHVPPAAPAGSRPGGVRAAGRPAARPPSPVGPAGRRRGRRGLGRRSAAGSAVAVLGVAAAFALGATPQRSATTPVDPASDAFVAEFVSTTSGGGPVAAVPAARSGVDAPFVPFTRGALLSSGGIRGGR